MKTDHLSITLLCPDKIGVITEVAYMIHECGCKINNTQMSCVGNFFAANLLVSGNWSTIAKLEAHLAKQGQQQGYHIIACRSETTKPTREALPFTVQVLGRFDSTMVYEVAHFFAEQGLHINELTGHQYLAKHTQTPMFCLNLSVNIPTDLHIADIREQFVFFCDECNWDGMIEPEQA